MHESLFQPLTMGALEAKNRIFMAPLTRGRSTQPGSVPNEMMATYYRQRASAGLIISEATGISVEGLGWPAAPGIWSDEQVEGWKPITDGVHEEGGRIVLQMWHMGRIVHPDFLGGEPPVSASATTAPGHAHTPTGRKDYAQARALTVDEIKRVVEDYRKAGENAKKAGFDGVQIHAANGYLIDEFLRNGVNQRTDDYGGSVENRARLVLDVVDAVIAAAGDAGIVGIRISPLGTFNGVEDANPLETFSYLLGELNSRGLAYVHVNKPDWAGGSYEGFDELLAALRKVYKGDFILAGGLDGDSASAALDGGLAQFAAFGRPYIANPDLGNSRYKISLTSVFLGVSVGF